MPTKSWYLKIWLYINLNMFTYLWGSATPPPPPPLPIGVQHPLGLKNLSCQYYFPYLSCQYYLLYWNDWFSIMWESIQAPNIFWETMSPDPMACAPSSGKPPPPLTNQARSAPDWHILTIDVLLIAIRKAKNVWSSRFLGRCWVGGGAAGHH